MNQHVQSQSPQIQHSAMGTDKQRTVIVGVDMSFVNMVKLLFTIAVASIPAMILVFIFFSILAGIFIAVFGSIGSMMLGG